MIIAQISASLIEWAITGALTAVVVLLWTVVRNFANKMTKTQESHAEWISSQHDLSVKLIERMEASQASYIEDKKVVTKRLDAHAKAIRCIDKKQGIQGSEIRHMQEGKIA